MGDQLSHSEGLAANIHASPTSRHSSIVLGNSKSQRGGGVPWAATALTLLHQLETARGGVLRSSSLLRTAATYEKRHNTE